MPQADDQWVLTLRVPGRRSAVRGTGGVCLRRGYLGKDEREALAFAGGGCGELGRIGTGRASSRPGVVGGNPACGAGWAFVGTGEQSDMQPARGFVGAGRSAGNGVRGNGPGRAALRLFRACSGEAWTS